MPALTSIQNQLQPYTSIQIVAIGGGGSNIADKLAEKSDPRITYQLLDRHQPRLRHPSTLPRTLVHLPLEADDLAQLEIVRGTAPVLVIIATLGGQAGNELSVQLAQAAQRAGQALYAVVTTPFAFEGPERLAQAEWARQQLASIATGLITLSNEEELQRHEAPDSVSLIDLFTGINRQIASLLL